MIDLDMALRCLTALAMRTPEGRVVITAKELCAVTTTQIQMQTQLVNGERYLYALIFLPGASIDHDAGALKN